MALEIFIKVHDKDFDLISKFHRLSPTMQTAVLQIIETVNEDEQTRKEHR